MTQRDPDLALIVTGAAGWLGREIVENAIQRTGQVTATYRRAASNPSPQSVVLENLDLATDEGVSRLSAHIAETQAPRLAVIHCAGSFPLPKPMHSTGLRDFERSLSANTLSFLGAVAAAVPAMRKRKHGRFIAFSSHTRRDNYPFFGAFNIAKAALESAVLTVAHENGRFGIAANAVCVATLQTDEERRIKPQGKYADWLPPKTVSQYAIELAMAADTSLNGSLIQYWRHSSSFFGSSMFERNSIDIDAIDPE